MIPSYVVRPLWSLLDMWQVKVPLTGLIAVVWAAIEEFIGGYSGLFELNLMLVRYVILIVFLDSMSGVMAAYQEKGWGAITSYRFRHTGWKIIEYVMVVIAFEGLDSATVSTFAEPLFEHFGNAALIYVALTEMWSLGENLKRIGFDFAAIAALTRGDMEAVTNQMSEDDSS